jgi:iron complex outermembrane receptor protein
MSFQGQFMPRLAAGLIATSFAAPLSAQVLEEIVVTAQKSEQQIQDVGITINAFSGEQMKALNIEDSVDVARFAPGVHISGALAGLNSQFTIRGVTQTDFNDIVEAPNAVYLDEGYIPIAQAQTFALFDIERVEILKGPQGTLFGRNATGGLVQYISRKPTFDKAEGYADVTYGIYDTDDDPDTFRVEAAVGGPIADTLAGRVAIMHNNQDAYLENLYDPNDQYAFGAATIGTGSSNAPGPGAGADMADDETTAFRGILQWEPSDSLRFTLSANSAGTDTATAPYQSKPTTPVYDGSDPDPAVQLSTGELINVIDTPLTDSRRSICADGTDCGSDQDNNGFPDDFNGDGLADIARVTNTFQLSPGTDFFGYRDPDGEEWQTYGDFAFDDQSSVDTWGLSLRFEWDLSDTITLTSITDYKDFEKLIFLDVDSAPVNQSVNYAGLDADSVTQELRLNGTTERTRWITGLYYLHIDNTSDNGLKFPINSVVDGNLSTPEQDPFDLGSDAHLQTTSYSAFGQIEYDLSDTWTLILGGRVIQEEKDYEFSQNIYFNPNSSTIHEGFSIRIGPTYPGGVPTAFTDDTDDTLWAGKIQLDWKPTEDWLLFAGVNRGTKAGSFNAQLAGGLAIPDSAIPYDDETLWAYEGGFKSTWLGGSTRFNGSVYYYDYKDYQAFLFTGVGGVVINADANNVGMELELHTTPIEGLDILLGVSWFNAEVEDVPLRVGGPIVRDVEPTYAPEVQASGLVRYEWPMLGGYASVQGDFAYSDEFYYNLRNFDADQFDSYTLVNAHLGWRTEDQRWAGTLGVRNLTDEQAGIHGYDLATLCGCNELSFRPPRTYAANVKYSF